MSLDLLVLVRKTTAFSLPRAGLRLPLDCLFLRSDCRDCTAPVCSAILSCAAKLFRSSLFSVGLDRSAVLLIFLIKRCGY